MKPAKRFIILLGIAFLLSVGAIFLEALFYLSVLFLVVMVVITMIDYFYFRSINPVTVERIIKPVFPISNWQTVTIKLHNHSNHTVCFDFYDDVPEHIEQKGMPVSLLIKSRNTLESRYQVISYRRGHYHFNGSYIMHYSRSGLFRKKIYIENVSSVRIYPDYMPVLEYALLATTSRTAMMGIHKIQKRGTGDEFFELREYQEGDSIRQIDWRSTARFDKLISREYQAQQDQNILFLMDASHRMNIPVGKLKHFDYALNAMLLTSYMALKQGDAVGVSIFGQKQTRISKPLKGMKQFERLLETLYTVQPGNTAADYLSLAQEIVVQHKKRSTLIIITNARDSDADELIAAVRYLQKFHRVIIASLKEPGIENISKSEISSFSDALTRLAADDYNIKRARVIANLKKRYANTIDVLPDELPLALANQYLLLKAS